MSGAQGETTPEAAKTDAPPAKPRVRIGRFNAPVDGETVTLDAGDAFRFVEGVAQNLEDLSKVIDNLEVSLNRLGNYVCDGKEKELLEVATSDLEELREERTYLGANVADLHELVIGDTYAVHNEEVERRFAAKQQESAEAGS